MGELFESPLDLKGDLNDFDKEDYKAFDPELWNAIDAEAERQQNNIELIASENGGF